MEPEELDSCAELYDRVVRRTFTWFDRLDDQAAKFRSEAAQEEVYVALAGGRLVGLVSFYRPDSFLHSLYVDYAEHGRGVGAALLAHIEAIAEAPVSLKVQTRNLQARRFYERNGFKIVEEGQDSEQSQWVRMARVG
jgi:ribosomal protein S18 acetylase RimI-like enzyme